MRRQLRINASASRCHGSWNSTCQIEPPAKVCLRNIIELALRSPYFTFEEIRLWSYQYFALRWPYYLTVLPLIISDCLDSLQPDAPCALLRMHPFPVLLSAYFQLIGTIMSSIRVFLLQHVFRLLQSVDGEEKCKSAQQLLKNRYCSHRAAVHSI